MKNIKLLYLLILLCLMPYISGCAFVAVGGAATAATVSVDRRTPGTQIEDQTIEIKANQTLNNDPELNEQAHWNVISYNTVVLLTGETPTDALRQKALALVKSIDKVTHVYNEITIAAPSSMVSRTSDSYITTKVKTQMFANKKLIGIEIKVATDKGVVYLMGIVSRAEAEIATEIARQTGGAQKVVKLFQYID
ncbi:MAG: BON domain-containing protein [Legionellales bacterium]|nr:BON domain-containing protein [Legionellales bacterium]